jgi:hypothetical protein
MSRSSVVVVSAEGFSTRRGRGDSRIASRPHLHFRRRAGAGARNRSQQLCFQRHQRDHQLSAAGGRSAAAVFIWQTNEELGFTQVPVSIAFVRLLRSQLEGIAAAGGGGPLTFIAVSLVLVAVAQIASLVPARRSVKVDPVEALRMD